MSENTKLKYSGRIRAQDWNNTSTAISVTVWSYELHTLIRSEFKEVVMDPHVHQQLNHLLPELPEFSSAT
jgi:hypothetical protein